MPTLHLHSPIFYLATLYNTSPTSTILLSSRTHYTSGPRRLRKQIKIRPGFTPQEDVRRFRGTRQAQMDANALPKGHVIGWTPPPAAAAAAPGSAAAASKAGMTKAQKKNEKRKEKRKEKRDEKVKDSWEDEDEEEDECGGDLW